MLAALLLLAAAPSRIALGQYGGWGAFREGGPTRCWAVAEPAGHGRETGPFLAIVSRPSARIAGQLHVHLRGARPGRTVTLRLGDRRFPLQARDADAWASDAREDARIVSALRRADDLTIEVKDGDGRHHIDHYALTGAASAIDAAALGCLR